MYELLWQDVCIGGCTFDDGPGPCDYHQDLYDDFDWVHVSAQEPHYLPPEMPQDSREGKEYPQKLSSKGSEALE
ncbi:hypothetical protein TURU_084841 [Turdus rufiventris]|nr:hypothetical protein TURU_084841 [Turdus rufiventris]